MPTKLSNPTALGLACFAVSLTVLSFENLGWIGSGSAVALALFFGGVVEILVGFTEFWTGNTFAMTVFGSYGAFWTVLGFSTWATMHNWYGAAGAPKGWLLGLSLAYTIITAIFLVATTHLLKSLFAIFLTLELLFVLLDAALLGAGPAGKILWYEALLCAGTAWYLLAAIVINDAFGREALPLGAWAPATPKPAKKMVAAAASA
jgi:succinate-acetate transporter protein